MKTSGRGETDLALVYWPPFHSFNSVFTQMKLCRRRKKKVAVVAGGSGCVIFTVGSASEDLKVLFTLSPCLQRFSNASLAEPNSRASCSICYELIGYWALSIVLGPLRHELMTDCHAPHRRRALAVFRSPHPSARALAWCSVLLASC